MIFEMATTANDLLIGTTTPWFNPSTPAGDALPAALKAIGDVPIGWRPLLRDALCAMIAVRTKAREFSLLYISVECDDGRLILDMPFSDSVLDGVARRCSERSRFICQECGRRGKVRQFGMGEAAVLCPRCAAPELLHRAIDDLDQFRGLIAHGGVLSDIQLLPTVLHRLFRPAASTGAFDSRIGPIMDKATLARWIDSLKRMKSSLPPPVVKCHWRG